MDRISLSAPAKINLGLWVGRSRLDGYHEIITTLVPLELHDLIYIRKEKMGVKVKTSGINLDLPQKHNLAYRAAELFFQETKIQSGCLITIKKNIPVGAGLGGGSSNAATVLIGLNRLFGSPLNYTGLKKLAMQLGSDVPFFLLSVPCVARGRGEKLRPVRLPRLDLILHYPGFSISTAWAYNQLDRIREKLTSPLISPKILCYKLRRNELAGLAEQVYNSFETIVFSKYPHLAQVKNLLLANGAIVASLSGSGSTVYGLLSAPDPMAELTNSGLPWILTRSRPSDA